MESSSQINHVQIPLTPTPELASFSTISSNSNSIASSSSEHILNSSNYDVPDPNRIPQSVFATKSSTGTEWSVASNESLFSIQLMKSGDLGNTFGNNPELLTIGVPKDVIGGMKEGISGPLMELESHKQAEIEQGQNSNFKEKVEINVNVNVAPRGHISNFSNMSTPCESPASGVSGGRMSETSTNSHSSFAFPVLTTGGDANIKSGGESMQKLIQKEPVTVEPVAIETPETMKSPPPPQNGNWFSCFPCCTFAR